MDIATFFGVIVGFALVLGAIFLGGAVWVFINVPGLMIVFGGTFAAICVTFPLEEVLQALNGGMQVFATKRVKPQEVVNTMVRIAEISRREGLVALENIQTENAILKKACQLIADNADPVLNPGHGHDRDGHHAQATQYFHRRVQEAWRIRPLLWNDRDAHRPCANAVQAERPQGHRTSHGRGHTHHVLRGFWLRTCFFSPFLVSSRHGLSRRKCT